MDPLARQIFQDQVTFSSVFFKFLKFLNEVRQFACLLYGSVMAPCDRFKCSIFILDLISYGVRCLSLNAFFSQS